MTIQEALNSVTVFPVQANFITMVGINRALTLADDYTLVIGSSQAFELAKADIWMWVSKQPNLVEQEVGINYAEKIKMQLANDANFIYAKYGDAAFNGFTYGMIGENWNG